MSNPPVNPYRPPVSTVKDIPLAGQDGSFGVPARTVDAGRGSGWIGEGWALFKKAPVMWIVAFIVLVGVQFVLGLLPLLGSLLSVLAGPFFMVGTLAFTKGIAEDGQADIGQLFVGFKEKQGALVGVALLYFLAIIAILVVCVGAGFALIGTAAFSSGNPEQAMGALMSGSSGLGILLLALIAFALILLVAAAYWFAPGLVFYADLGAVEAFKQSFSGVLRNWLPFLVYGIVSLLVVIAGTVAVLLGLLVALPVLMASYYACFRDLYGQQP